MMSSSHSGNSAIVSNSAANYITISISNSVNSVSVSNSPASSIMMSSSHSGNSVLVSNSTSAVNCIKISSSNSVSSELAVYKFIIVGGTIGLLQLQCIAIEVK